MSTSNSRQRTTGDSAQEHREPCCAPDQQACDEAAQASPAPSEGDQGQTASLSAADIRAMADGELLKLATMAAEREHFVDLARRAQADFENFQKRTKVQRQEDLRYAAVPLVRELVGSVDNLERAIAAAKNSRDFDSMLAGVEMTQRLLVEGLRKYGVSSIEAKGTVFDPEVHEAVMTGNDDAVADDLVLECFEKGWKLHDRVLRPAKVKVNKKV